MCETIKRVAKMMAVMAMLAGCDCEHQGSFVAGELYGPCPLNELGETDLCSDESLACVPADDAEANICLSVAICDDPGFGTEVGVGWGGACYVRCDGDADCIDGMECAESVADGSKMCAWPL